MKKILLFILIILANDTIAQYTSIGHRAEMFFDSSRSRSITCDIYYPADVSGTNVSVVSDTFHFPVLVFGHGFVMATSSYESLRDSLVVRGYIMALPTTESGFAPSHLDFGKDIAFIAEQIQLSNLNNADLFFDRVANTTCVMGHSMGGGASFLSTQFYSGITAIANLAAAETNPSAISAASSLSIPALLIAGENDCITPAATNQLLMYNAIPSACKNLITINGGSHCQMADANFNCSIGEATCSPAPAISREDQQQKVLTYLSLWLDAVLKQNCQSGIDFENLRNSDTTITYLQFCNLCSSTDSYEKFNSTLTVYPNPFSESLTISMNEDVNFYSIVIKNVFGSVVFKTNNISQKIHELNLSDLKPGIYFLDLRMRDEYFSKRMIKINE
jgi:dienelactone hydrolase